MNIIEGLFGRKKSAEKRTLLDVKADAQRVGAVLRRNIETIDATVAELEALPVRTAAASMIENDAARAKAMAQIEEERAALKNRADGLRAANDQLEAAQQELAAEAEQINARLKAEQEAEARRVVIAAAQAALKELPKTVEALEQLAAGVKEQLEKIPDAEMRNRLLQAVLRDVIGPVELPSATIISLDEVRERTRQILAAKAEGRDLRAEEEQEAAKARLDRAKRFGNAPTLTTAEMREVEANLIQQDAPGGSRYAHLAGRL